MIISGLVGSEAAEKILLYLENYEKGYAREISNCYDLSVSQVQKQLQKFEREGLMVSRLYGKVRIYEWNPRYLFLAELRQLLAKALRNLPESIEQKYYRNRTRPRRAGKPL
jgi:DNA-binding transcriptional ArsR family regulator